jgi:hypothetical protein
MTQRDRIVTNKHFLHQQTQDLLAHCDVQRIGSHSQFTAKTRQVLCQL